MRKPAHTIETKPRGGLRVDVSNTVCVCPQVGYRSTEQTVGSPKINRETNEAGAGVPRDSVDVSLCGATRRDECGVDCDGGGVSKLQLAGQATWCGRKPARDAGREAARGDLHP